MSLSCEFGACGAGMDFTQPGQTDQTNSTCPQYPYLPPWLPGNRNRQGRPPGRPTEGPTPRPGGEPPPSYPPANEPGPGQTWKYVFLQMLRIFDNQRGGSYLFFVDPRAVCAAAPPYGPNRPAFCPPPTL